MTREKVLVVLVLVMFSLISVGYSLQPVAIEFLYYEPCKECEGFEGYYQAYVHNTNVVNSIQQDYEDKVLVERIPCASLEGLEKMNHYNLTYDDWNSVVVNYEVVLRGGERFINETYLRELIDFYLERPPIHDVAVADVIPSSSSVSRGEILDINVTAKNEGTQIESFNVTVYRNSTIIETVFVDGLEPNVERKLICHWNTTEVGEGNYTLSARADILQNETDTDDNLAYGKVIEVRAPFTPPPIRHDIAIISLTPSQTVANVGEKVNFTVTVKNFGTETESFNVGAYCNESQIEIMIVTNLGQNESRLMIFSLDTTNKTVGHYTIRVQAEPVLNETDLTDNERTCEIRVKEPPNGSPYANLGLAAMLMVALTVGFFETFSPCLIIMLSFVLSYTIGKSTRFKDSFLQAVLFGTGFVFAAAVLGVAFGMIFLSLSALRFSLTLIVCIFAVLFGLNLVGLLRLPFDTKPLIQKLTRKYVVTYGGLLILGFVFYFLDPCLAPIFFSMVPLLFSDVVPLILFVFCLGAIIPFICIGLFAGSVSKLARTTYKHRFIIRAISGSILISYAIYLAVLLLIR